jgi:hypothetical protein
MDYCYQDNMHIIEEIVNLLHSRRCVALFDNYESAIQDIFLYMYPCTGNEQEPIIRNLWKQFEDDSNIKEWFYSDCRISIEKK